MYQPEILKIKPKEWNLGDQSMHVESLGGLRMSNLGLGALTVVTWRGSIRFIHVFKFYD